MSHVRSDVEYDMLRSQRIKDQQAKANLRQKIHDKISLVIMGNPVGNLNQGISQLTEWTLNLLSSEVISTDIKVLGLTVEQIQKLKDYFERTTGNNAETSL